MSPRVFLTNPPLNMAETPLEYHRPLIPMGLAYLGAVLEHHFSDGAYERHVEGTAAGRDASHYRPSGRVAAQDNMFLSFYGRFNLDELLQRMENFFHGVGPEEQVIGVSVLSDGMRGARRLLRAFRRHFPVATILVGGPHATFYPYDFFEDVERREGPFADYVVRNEAEHLILPLVEGRLERWSQVEDAANALGIDIAGSDYANPEYRVLDGGQFGARAATPHPLDALPTPAYFLFADAEGRLPYEPDRRYGLESPAANLNTSRGCPHRCTFCTIPKLAPGYRTMSPARIISVLRYLVRGYGVRSVFFREDNFLYAGGVLDGDRWPDVRAMCEALESERLGLRIAVEARADNLLAPSGDPARSRLAILHAAGLTGVYIGVESASDTMLRLYVKDEGVEQMSAVLRACAGEEVAVIATALYGDPDVFQKRAYPMLARPSRAHARDIVATRERILVETRRFLDAHDVPLKCREEYALVGIPVSTTYALLDKFRARFPAVVEHYDPVSRYIYPKGFRWWATKLYAMSRLVRPFIDYDYVPESEAE